MSENMKTKIVSGAYELVLSEQIMMDSLDSELIIDLVVNKINMGNMRIRFLHKDGAEISLNSYSENEELILECINFDEKLNAGTLEMVPIGKVEGKELKMHLWINMLGKRTVRRVDINLYKEQ